MGKRELVLIVAFIFAGTLLYHATAPPAPGDSGFSLRGMMGNLRRHLGPRHEYLADERTERLPVETTTTELRIAGATTLRVEGTEKDEAGAKVQVYSTGVDETEARALGKRTILKKSAGGDILSLEVVYPPEGRQRTVVTLAVPRRMKLRVRRSNNLEVRNIAGLEFDETRGEATLTGITGAIRGTHTGGELTFERVREIDMTARRSDITMKDVSGNVRLDLTGGSFNGRALAGDIEIAGNRTSIELERVGGSLTANLTQGSLEATHLSRQARVDARGTELRIELDKPAPLTAITTDEDITVRLPQGAGFALDATAEDGSIRLPADGPQPATTDQTTKARGPISGGGPTLALRTSHGDIVIR